MESNSGDKGVNRRRFLGLLGLTPLAAAVLAPVAATGSYLAPPESLTAPPQPMFVDGLDGLTVGAIKNFTYNNAAAVIMKKGAGEYQAFYRKCTHLGCTVQWKEPERIFVCPCHGGKFDADGKNIYGPPPSPLIPLKVTVLDGRVQVEEV